MTRLLFVCLGNICRSPTGEAVMQHIIKEHGLENEIFCDSAGTIGYHAGNPADSRMRKHGQARGYSLDSISRRFNYPDDFENFDYILAMDNQNYRDLASLDRNDTYSDKLYRMCDFCVHLDDQEVPDPYYGGAAGFEHVLDIMEDACHGLLSHIKSRQ